MRRDWEVTRYLATARPDWATPLLELLALPGDLIVVVLVLGLCYLVSVWHHRHRQDVPLANPTVVTSIAIVFGGLALVVLIESIVGAGRPPTDWHAIEPSPHGFPSGHTMAATVLWGTLAWRHWSSPHITRFVAVGLLIIAVAISRLTLGVHYLPDVLAAILIGAIYLGVADSLTNDRPPIAFSIALAIGIGALITSGASTRAVLAFGGTTGAFLGWYVTERPVIRRRIRSLLTAVRP